MVQTSVSEATQARLSADREHNIRRPWRGGFTRCVATLQKIVTADFSFPPAVAASDEVRDLLQRIFVVNAAHRLNLEGIKAHPWFLRNLPAELQARPVRRCAGTGLTPTPNPGAEHY